MADEKSNSGGGLGFILILIALAIKFAIQYWWITIIIIIVAIGILVLVIDAQKKRDQADNEDRAERWKSACEELKREAAYQAAYEAERAARYAKAQEMAGRGQWGGGRPWPGPFWRMGGLGGGTWRQSCWPGQVGQ